VRCREPETSERRTRSSRKNILAAKKNLGEDLCVRDCALEHRTRNKFRLEKERVVGGEKFVTEI
jgi:hypothetical protein